MAHRDSRRVRWRAGCRIIAVLWLVTGPGTVARGQDVLPVLARVGPWPVAASLIGYGDRLWLVNSVKGVNHNSADVYSYDPARGALRYERHLFSHATTAALIGRLDHPGNPEWLRGDAVGALTALTGQRFGYDIAAWRAWWDAAGPVRSD